MHYKKIKAIDRGFVHGDIVASASDPNGQTCTVVDVVLTVDLQLVKTGIFELVTKNTKFALCYLLFFIFFNPLKVKNFKMFCLNI